MEEWKVIPGFTRYLASSEGRIKNTNWRQTKKTKMMKLKVKYDGYVGIQLARDYLTQYPSLLVHRLIALVFIPNPNNYPEINHKNSIRTDNRVENLEWCTHQYNMTHANEEGNHNVKGENHPLAKLTNQDIIDIRAMYFPRARLKNNGKYNCVQIANMYNLNVSTIRRIIKNRSWSHIK